MFTILIVDDSPVERAMMSAVVLKRMPAVSVVTANGGVDAMKVIADQPIDLVLTDLLMPDINGLQLVEEIRKSSPQIPVILMTGYGNEDTAVQALRAGAASYVPKREAGTELVPTIQQILNLSQTRRTESHLFSCITSSETVFSLRSETTLVAPLVNHLESQIGTLGLYDAGEIVRISIALQESITNAMLHGNLEVSSDLRQEDEAIFYDLAARRRKEKPFCDRRVRLIASISHEKLQFAIRDDGPGFDTVNIAAPDSPPDLERIGGRGLILIRSFMDVVYHNASGNEITLIKYARSLSNRNSAAAEQPSGNRSVPVNRQEAVLC